MRPRGNPMTPQDVAELSRLLDEALALEPPRASTLARAIGAVQAGDGAALAEDAAQRRIAGRHDGTAEVSEPGVDDAVAHAGERVGPYQLIREIGRGGMGSVWLAERADGTFKRKVALKLPRMTWAAGLAKRMARERDLGALLEHPNIARPYDAGVDEHGRPYIAMEYIEGQPIDVYCAEHALDVRTKLALFLRWCRRWPTPMGD